MKNQLFKVLSHFMNKLKQKNLSGLIAKYSLSFFVFAFFCVIIFFLLDKKSIIDINDGLQIRYTGFIYSGRIVRTLFKNIFVDHVFELPMWDRTIGMGSDYRTITSLIADPFYSLVSVLVPVKYSEYAFNFLVIVQLYFSGFSFLLFVYEKGYSSINALAGSMVYAFSATAFIIFTQISFSSSFILFPLFLLASDRVWKKKSSLLYVVILTYSTFYTYYFTYMMLILLVIYCLIRFFCEEDRSIKRFLSLLSRFVIPTLISLITAFGLILPTLTRLSKLSRIKTHYDIAFFDLEVIKRLFTYAFSCIQADGDSLIGMSSFVFVAIVCLFVSKKKEPVIKWCLALLILSFAFPFIGSVFNGFNYVSYRYIFSFILCAAYLVTVSFDSTELFKGRFWYASLGASALYCIICFLFIEKHSLISAFSLLGTVLLVGIINLFERYLKKIRDKLYILVILISCVLVGFACIHISKKDSMTDSGTVYETVFLNGGMPLRKKVDDPQYRTDTISADFSDRVMNSSMANGVSGFDLYNSVQSQLTEDYYTILDVLGNPMEFSLGGFRSRCYLEILNACNFIARSDKSSTCIRAPYSYDYVETDGEYSLYRSDRGVSLVYYYDDVISYDSFMEMNSVMRETNLMYSMVVDEPEQPENEVVTDVISVPYEIESYDNMTVEGNTITVQDGVGMVTLKPEEIAAGQVVVYLSGLRHEDDVIWHYRNAVALLDSEGNPIVIDYSAKCTTNYKYYHGNDNVVFSFESIDEKTDKICILFLTPGEYTLDDIHVYSRPYEQMSQTLDAFYEHADMEDISYEYSGNHLNISTTTDSDSYLYIAIPYSEGWKAKVDGKETGIINANITFMAIPLTAGNHVVEMTYCTPRLYLGLCISAFGIILTAGYLIIEKKMVLKKSA